MDPNELSRAISSIQETQKKVEVVFQEAPNSVVMKPTTTIISSPGTFLQRLPGISVSQQQIALPPEPPQIVQSVVVQPPTSKPPLAQVPSAGRVVVERIGGAFKVVQPNTEKDTTTMIVPAIQQVVLPRTGINVSKSIKVITSPTSTTAPARIVLARAPVRNIAPKAQSILVPRTVVPGVSQMPVSVARKMDFSKDASKLDKIVFVRKTAGGMTELVKIPAQPGPSKEPTKMLPAIAPAPVATLSAATTTTTTSAPIIIRTTSKPQTTIIKSVAPVVTTKPLTEEQKIDQLMKDLLDKNAEAEGKVLSKNDFQTKELQLIKNLKRNPHLSTQKKEVVISAKQPVAIRPAVPHPKPPTLVVSKNTAGIRTLSPVQISTPDPKKTLLLKTLTENAAPNVKKVPLAEKLQEAVVLSLEKKAVKEEGGVLKPPANIEKTIEIEISDGMLSDPNGPIKVMGAQDEAKETQIYITVQPVEQPTKQEKSPRTQVRSQSLIDSNKVDSIKRNIRSQSMPETQASEKIPLESSDDVKMEDSVTIVKMIDENLLCDEDIEQVSPNKVKSAEQSEVSTPAKQNKRKTAHKTLEDRNRSEENVLDASGIKDEEDEEVDIISYGNKLSQRKRSPVRPPLKRKMDADSDDEGARADVLHVPIGKLFEYGVEPDDIYLSDPFRYINWKDGVGSLRNGSIHFKINEYGVYEVMSNEEYYHCRKTRPDRQLSMALTSRSSRKKRKIDDTTYTCSTCGESGIAEEFIEPNVCSWQCKETSLQLNRVRALDKYEPDESKDFEEPELKTPDSSQSSYSDEDMQEEMIKETDAPLHLFKNSFPKTKNNFAVGMKLEAIDPFNEHLFCVCSVVEKRGFRLKLRFDGYSPEYDFWINADAKTIFPPGWCVATGRNIQSPAHWPKEKKFNWTDYLKDPKVMAPVHLFPHLHEDTPSGWNIGQKIEVDLPEGEGDGVTAATVRDIINNRILIELDFYKTSMWLSIDSHKIHPAGWHQEANQSFNSPQKDFIWTSYLRAEKSSKVPDEMFKPRPPLAFSPGMKLEVVDKINTNLLRPATVMYTNGYRVRILFDGWPNTYAFWLNDDSTDLHPVGWAKYTKHPLEPIVGVGKVPEICSVFRGCLGFGNARNKTRPFHRAPDECPYFPRNWNQPEVSERLAPMQKARRTWKRTTKPQAAEPAVAMDTSNEQEEPDLVVDRKKLTLNDAATQRDELWNKNSNKMPMHTVDESNAYTWSSKQVEEFVAKIPGCEKHAAIFQNEQVNGSAFITLTKDDLMGSFGLKFGPALKVYSRILKLRELALKKVSKA